MALNGEVVSDRAQHRIRKMVENHFFIAELQAKHEKVASENKQLKQQISQNRITTKSPQTRQQKDENENENEQKNHSFNYRLNFSKGTLAGKKTRLRSPLNQDTSDILGESGDTLDNFTLPMPLKNSTKENRPRGVDRMRTSQGQDKSMEITGEDFYHITTDGTNDVNQVMRKIEEARRQIVTLEQEARKQTQRSGNNKDELSPYVNEFGMSEGTGDDNFTVGNLEATS